MVDASIRLLQLRMHALLKHSFSACGQQPAV